MGLKTIIEMPFAIELVDKSKMHLLAGQSVILLYSGSDNISINMHTALCNNKITATFIHMDEERGDSEYAFALGYLMCSLKQDILYIGTHVFTSQVSQSSQRITYCNSVADLPKLLSRSSKGSKGSESQTRSRKRQKRVDENIITPVDPNIQNDCKEIVEIPPEFKKSLDDINISSFFADKNNCNKTIRFIYEAFLQATNSVDLDIQLRIHLLDKDLCDKLYPILSSNYQFLKGQVS